jgi:DNA-binding CsgD family transcriptional regulator/tetratricopeptide (TPR) repeat protein
VHHLIAGIERLQALPDEVARGSWSTINWMADALPVIDFAGSGEIDPAADTLIAEGVNHRRGGLPWFLAASGRLAGAQREGERFRSVTGGLVEMGPLVLSATGHTAFGLGIVHASMGRPAEARAEFARAREVYRRLDHHAVIAFTLLTELTDVVMPYLTDNRSERARVANEAQQALERAGGALAADISGSRAQLVRLYLDGYWDEAREIGADQSSHGNYQMRRQITQAIAPIACHQGAYDEVWRHIRALLPNGPDTEPGSAVLFDALLLQRLAAHRCLEQGEVENARRWLIANDRWLAWSGALLGQAENQIGWATFHQRAGHPSDAQRCIEAAVRAAESPRQPLGLLTALRLRGELARERGDRQSAERDLAAALAIAEQGELPFERAQTLALLATVQTSPTAATAMLAEARGIAAQLGAKPLLARIETPSNGNGAQLSPAQPVAGLTARELDVLRLVARGLTDAEIGEQLFISPRTASQHLRSVYSKLDLHSRASATRFAIEHQLA